MEESTSEVVNAEEKKLTPEETKLKLEKTAEEIKQTSEKMAEESKQTSE